MAAKKPNNPMALQAQIRQNADEVSTMLSTLGKWEKNMKNKDEGIRKVRSAKGSAAAPAPGVRGGVRSGAGTVKTSSTTAPVASLPAPGTEVGDGKAGSAAKHTYDVGYKKWEKFDIDAALNENEGDADGEDIVEFNYENVSSNPVVEVVREGARKFDTCLAGHARRQCCKSLECAAKGAQSPWVHLKDAETAEREQGNKEFAAGQFPQAVKSYTKCLGLKKRNYSAFSNRAMAYLKLKEYIRAEVDCNSALTIEPSHVKSLVRRATARNALGKHRAALGDIYAAMKLTEAAKGNAKQHRVDLQKTQELLRSCVSRAPMAKIQAKFADGDDQIGSVAGPDLPLA